MKAAGRGDNTLDKLNEFKFQFLLRLNVKLNFKKDPLLWLWVGCSTSDRPAKLCCFQLNLRLREENLKDLKEGPFFVTVVCDGRCGGVS